MCKHVAAVLYGVGARLDERPELLFVLRGVEERDLLASAGAGQPLAKTALTTAKAMSRPLASGLEVVRRVALSSGRAITANIAEGFQVIARWLSKRFRSSGL